MSESAAQRDGSARRLADYLRAHREAILDAWEARTRTMRPARSLARPALLDHLPQFLDQLADYVEGTRAGEHPSPPEKVPQIHALERLDEGYDLAEVVAEYGLLRSSLVELVQHDEAPALRSAELPRLHEAIDLAISTSVVRYTMAREKTLRALDRIATAALAHPDVQGFLDETLRVLLETTASVDSVLVLLVEDGLLRVRASAGAAAQPGATLRMGECIAGRIAEERTPHAVRDARSDPLVQTDLIDRAQTLGIYGVPLLLGPELIGVALMGSRTAREFSHEDRLLFRTMAARATAILAQGRLRENEQHALREREAEQARLAAVLRLLPVGVGIAEAPSGRLLVLNEEAQRIWGGYVADDLDHVYSHYKGYYPDGRLIPPDERPLVRALQSGQPVPPQEVHALHPDGERRIVEMTAAPIRNARGELIAAVATSVDVTNRKRTEEELRRALLFRDQIMAVLSHDLRTPLMVMMTGAELLFRDEAITERQARTAARVKAAGERIERMIRDLLDYTRARHGGGIPLARRELDLEQLFRQWLEQLSDLERPGPLTLSIEGETRGSFDADRLQQLFSNLVGNAVRHGGEKGVSVRLRGEPLEVLIEVHNGGAPIAPELLPNIFEAFRRGPARERDGLGLGLYIVRAIASAHGGSVEARSDAESGTTFTVRLPRQ